MSIKDFVASVAVSRTKFEGIDFAFMFKAESRNAQNLSLRKTQEKKTWAMSFSCTFSQFMLEVMAILWLR
jgi:hypothetical protein